MTNKTRAVWLSIFIFLAVASVLTALLVIFLPGREDLQPLCFVREDRSGRSGSLFVTEKQVLSPGSGSSLSYLMLNALIAGPSGAGLVSPFPAGTRVLQYRLEEQTAYIDFSLSYGHNDPFTLALADYCLASTLTGVDDIQRFKVTIGGMPHPGFPEPFSLSDFLTDGLSLIPSTRMATLYFPHPNNLYLMPRHEKLMVYAGGDLLSAALTVLLHGPEDAPVLAIAPPETAVLYVGEADGRITVNLSRAFLDYSSAGELQARMILYSIVNTLTGLVSSESVQFLIEGEVISSFGGIPLLEPLTRDPSLIFGLD